MSTAQVECGDEERGTEGCGKKWRDGNRVALVRVGNIVW